MKRIAEFLKKHDKFGSAVTLRYGSWTRKESTGDEKHKSLFGGIISILSDLFVYGTFTFFFVKMITYDNNKITAYNVQPDWNRLSEEQGVPKNLTM